MSKTKTGLFILALSVMLVGAGCGNNANNNAPADTTPPSDVTQNNDPAVNDPGDDPTVNDPAINENPLTDDPTEDPLTDDEVIDPDAPADDEATTTP